MTITEPNRDTQTKPGKNSKVWQRCTGSCDPLEQYAD